LHYHNVKINLIFDSVKNYVSSATEFSNRTTAIAPDLGAWACIIASQPGISGTN
jgi:hypothetical protein